MGNKYNLGRKHSEETIRKIKAAFDKRRVHPSLRSYDAYGCRCDECRAIKREYSLKSRIRLKESRVSLDN